MALYASEGFLADAQRVEAILDELPEEGRRSYDSVRIADVIEALEALQT